MNEKKFNHYVWYLIARFKSKIKQAQNNKRQSNGMADDIYKMGYLMALYNLIEDMEVFTSYFGITREEVGLGCDIKEVLKNFLNNLSYISDDSYQNRIDFKRPKDYEGEFNQLNDILIDQCEVLHMLGIFDGRCKQLLSNFYCHIEPFFQDYDGMYEPERKESWEEIVDIAKEILEEFDFRLNQKLDQENSETLPPRSIHLNKEEYDYLSQASFLPKILKKMMIPATPAEKGRIEGLPYWIDEIRNLCKIQLQVTGFNKSYESTPEGKILEDLVDKFYIG